MHASDSSHHFTSWLFLGKPYTPKREIEKHLGTKAAKEAETWIVPCGTDRRVEVPSKGGLRNEGRTVRRLQSMAEHVLREDVILSFFFFKKKGCKRKS